MNPIQRAKVITTAPLTVKQDLATQSVTAKRLASYTPVIGHSVAIVPYAGTVLILGQVVD